MMAIDISRKILIVLQVEDKVGKCCLAVKKRLMMNDQEGTGLEPLYTWIVVTQCIAVEVIYHG
jgi:hypothetical protein